MLARLQTASRRVTSPLAVWEAVIAVARILGLPVSETSAACRDYLKLTSITVLDVTAETRMLAIEAYDRMARAATPPGSRRRLLRLCSRPPCEIASALQGQRLSADGYRGGLTKKRPPEGAGSAEHAQPRFEGIELALHRVGTLFPTVPDISPSRWRIRSCRRTEWAIRSPSLRQAGRLMRRRQQRLGDLDLVLLGVGLLGRHLAPRRRRVDQQPGGDLHQSCGQAHALGRIGQRATSRGSAAESDRPGPSR